MSERIDQILIVIRSMAETFKDVYPIALRRNVATQEAADFCNVASNTIRDKYARQLGISTQDFDNLLEKLFLERDYSIFNTLSTYAVDSKDKQNIIDLQLELFPNQIRSPIKISPSILSADFARLGEQVKEAEAAGADYIHIDVMDGHYVPAISFGPVVVQAVRKYTTIPLDVHLMIEAPERHLASFAQAKADMLTVHIETCPHIHRSIQLIKELNLKAGVALNPGTPLGAIEEILPYLDLVLVMTVNPGAGGQTFIPTMLDKIVKLRRELDLRKLNCELEVDGGINAETAAKVVKAGARVLVAGSAVFNPKEPIKDAVARIRASYETFV